VLFIPEFLIGGNVSVCEQCNAWKFEILVVNKYFHRHQVRRAHVVDESGNVAILSCVNAISFSVPVVQVEEIGVVFSAVGLTVCDHLSNIPENKKFSS
jgi:hypothetical protein